MSMGQKDAIDPYLCVIYLKKKKGQCKRKSRSISAEVSPSQVFHIILQNSGFERKQHKKRMRWMGKQVGEANMWEAVVQAMLDGDSSSLCDGEQGQQPAPEAGVWCWHGAVVCLWGFWMKTRNSASIYHKLPLISNYLFQHMECIKRV